MNRADRRRKDRDLEKKVKKVAKQTGLSEEAVKKMKNDATDEAFNKIFGALFTLPLMVLHKEFGFGKKRLQKFNGHLTDLLSEVQEGEVELNHLLDKMKDEFGIIFTNGENA